MAKQPDKHDGTYRVKLRRLVVEDVEIVVRADSVEQLRRLGNAEDERLYCHAANYEWWDGDQVHVGPTSVQSWDDLGDQDKQRLQGRLVLDITDREKPCHHTAWLCPKCSHDVGSQPVPFGSNGTSFVCAGCNYSGTAAQLINHRIIDQEEPHE